MPELRRDVFVLINTFTVDSARQQELIDVLDQATETVMRKRAGFISASFHKSFDGKHVATYAQWRSGADFEAMLQSPDAREHMGKAAAIAESFAPIGYELTSTHTAEA